jgi:hypothetical protein
MRGVSRVRKLTYQKQILGSYRWIFGEMETGSTRMDAYYDILLPWWLAPLNSPQQQQSGDTHQDQHSDALSPVGPGLRLRRLIQATALFFHLKKPQHKKQKTTLRALLRDTSGKKCKLPIDCLVQLDPFNHELTKARDDETSDVSYSDDDDDEEERLGISQKVSYEAYPVLAERIKVLIDHMEKQKPKGFIALWRDQRDSNTWYTFWAAVIFGVTALVLAAASLAVGAAQTWATFRGLDEAHR